MTNIIQGKTKARSSHKFGIIVSKFNEFITEKLLDGCMLTLKNNGVDEKNIDIVKVPGSFEIPTIAKNLIGLNKYDAIICLGAVIRGETSHYEYICTAVSVEIARLGTTSGMPVIFGVITCENLEQAQDRSGGKKGNKGSEAALAAVEMVNLQKELKIKFDIDLLVADQAQGRNDSVTS